MTRAMILAAALTLTACAGDTEDLFDAIEHESWEAAAAKVSAHCQRMAGLELWGQRTRIEFRREVRQRGSHGPAAPIKPIEGLDAKTQFGSGPVVFVICAGETDGDGEPVVIPDEAWRLLVRNWRD